MLSLTLLLVCCWNLIKDPLTPSISLGFYSQTGRGGSSNMVSEPGGFEFEPRPRIVIIPAYRSSYGGARVAQISRGGALTHTQ
jgi:hypothetical protein